MEWIEVTVRTTTAGADMVAELLMLSGAQGASIEDRADAAPVSEGPLRWDILDPSVARAMDEDVLVRGYLPADAAATERVATLRDAIAGLTSEALGFDAGALALSLSNVREEDWAENWKQYYKPFRVGKRLVIKPVWEDIPAAPDDLVIEIDPGMAFGNGTHETTAMCLALVEEAVRPGDTVLDVGTGSGILALAAAKLGANIVLAVDLDPVAVRVAKENVLRNGVSATVRVIEGDLLSGVATRANLIVANIIADAVILLAGAIRACLARGGLFISSGIIADREADVLAALARASLTVEKVERAGEWVAIVARG